MSRQAKLDDLRAELEALKLFNKQRIIVGKKYQAAKKRLVERIDDLEFQIESARREAERKQKEKEKAEKRFRAKNKPLVDVVFGRNGVADLVEKVYKPLKEKGVRDVRVLIGGRDIRVGVGRSSHDFFNQIAIVEGSDAVIRQLEEGNRIQVFAPSRIPAVRLRQMFRDGVNHCVFEPILKKLNERLDYVSEATAKKTRQKIKRMEAYREEFKDGVPEDRMEEVAKASGLKIVVKDLLGNHKLLVLNENAKQGTLDLINSRPNHVDEGWVVCADRKPEKISEEALISKWKECKKNKIPYTCIKKRNGEISRLNLLNVSYIKDDPDRDIMNKFSEEIGLKKYGLDANRFPDVNEFVKLGRLINSYTIAVSDVTPDKHYDMPKAYTQFQRCSYYAGFLGMIHQWRSGKFDRKWIEEHIGIYRFRVVKCDGWLKKFGLGGTHILPSVEILYMMDQGVEVEIDCGVWGSRMDFQFSKEILENKLYAKWSGRLSSDQENDIHQFGATREWAGHLQTLYGDNCSYWDFDEICNIKIPKKTRVTYHHIFAFITSYTRIQMLQAIQMIGVENVAKVLLDGIDFKGATPEDWWFVEKEMKEHISHEKSWYNFDKVDIKVDWPESWIEKRVALVKGQGGSGKTFRVLKDTGFNRPLFITPQHVLGEDIWQGYKVKYKTIHKLLGKECLGKKCQSLKDEGFIPAVIVIDEVTMIPGEWIEETIKMYPESQIICLGDLDEKQWFQCRGGKPGAFHQMWKPSADVQIIAQEGDRRSQDEELKKLKLEIRDKMVEVFEDGDGLENMMMKMWIREKGLITVEEAIPMFQEGDIWIAGTNAFSDMLIERGVVSGWQKQGGAVAFEETEGYEKRGSFTVHGFQGKTFSRGRIFIHTGDLFEYAMLYTAVSRAVRIEQIVLVE